MTEVQKKSGRLRNLATKEFKLPSRKKKVQGRDAYEKPKYKANTFFKATLVGKDGKPETLTVTSESRARARQKLIQEGHEILDLKAVRPWWLIEFGRPVKQVVILQITRQLAAFTAAGVPILQALKILSSTVADKRAAEALRTIAQDIEDGESLADAAKVHGDIFPAYYLAMLEAVQRSGELQGTFETLADYLERDLAASRAVKSALYYPVVLVITALVAISVISTYVLPKFVVFFDSLQVDLPLPTRILMDVSAIFGNYWWIALFFGLVVVSALLIYRRTPDGRLQLDTILLSMPIIGKLIQLVALERFTRILGSLSSSGVPIPDALALAAGVMTNKAFDLALRRTREGVIGGLGLTEPLAETGRFPEETIQILRVGEQTGRLSEQLEHAANYYGDELEYRLKGLTTLLEPIVLAVIGGGVGFVAIALVSAMYGIYSTGLN